MKKLGYCPDCKLEFEYQINNMEEFNNVFCPKCNKRVSNDYTRPKTITKADQVAKNVLEVILKVNSYFYLLIGALGLIFYYSGITKWFSIFAIVGLAFLLIDFLSGFIRGLIIMVLLCISIYICTLNGILNETAILLGTCFALLGYGIIKILFFKMLFKIDRLSRKK